jgi:hypothetical protein
MGSANVQAEIQAAIDTYFNKMAELNGTTYAKLQDQ